MAEAHNKQKRRWETVGPLARIRERKATKYRRGFKSHRRTLRRGAPPPRFSSKRLVPSGPRRACPVSRTVGGACSVQGFGTGAGPGRGSSEVEHQAHNLGVAGSIPVHNTPRSAEDRLLRDAENVSTTGPEGNGRPRRSALVRTEASSATRRPGGCDANGRPEARGFRRPSPTARGRRRGARREVSASCGRLPKRT